MSIAASSASRCAFYFLRSSRTSLVMWWCFGETTSQETWQRRSLSVMKSCNASMSKYTTSSWKSSMQCQSRAIYRESIWQCTEVYHQVSRCLTRLTRLTVSRRFPSTESSVTWCGRTRWKMKRLSMVTLRRIQSATAQTTLVKSLSSNCCARIDFWVSSVGTRSNRRVSRCTDGEPRTPSRT